MDPNTTQGRSGQEQLGHFKVYGVKEVIFNLQFKENKNKLQLKENTIKLVSRIKIKIKIKFYSRNINK